jgi:hypothetical protein
MTLSPKLVANEGEASPGGSVVAYSNKFVVSVFVDGQALKEQANGNVNIPFGSEYTIRFRNRNSRRAVVKFTIDGENVSAGGYIIEPHSHVDIERHAEIDRAFKFVSLDSSDAVEVGKNGPNDDKRKGLIEANFYFEKKRDNPKTVHHYYHHWKSYWTYTGINDLWGSGPAVYGSSTVGHSGTPTSNTFCNLDHGDDELSLNVEAEVKPKRGSIIRSCGMTTPPVEDGCTVEGSETGQQFVSSFVDIESTCTTIKLFMQGFVIEEAKAAKAKKKAKSKNNKLKDRNRRLREEIERKKLEKENADLKAELESLSD